MEERIRQAQAGDETAFEQIVAAYAPLATRTALALVHDRAIAEEVVQDTWLNVWRTLPRFDATRPFRPWLLTIVARRPRPSRAGDEWRSGTAVHTTHGIL